MLASKIKQKLQTNQVSIGTWLTMAHISVAEILASVGYDWVMIETEHTAIDVSEVLGLIIAIEGRGATPLVRLAGNDPIQAKAVMDAGAAGVVVPMINNKAEAEQAVNAIKYPPLGQRGACGGQRAQGYGFGYQDYNEYIQNANQNSLVIVQIEHIEAVENIDEISSVPGIDGTFIGPYDLSLSLGIPGQLNHPDIKAAKQRVLEATKAHGLAPGIHLVHPDTAATDLAEHTALGYQFIALGTDILFLGDSCRQLYATARSVLNA